MYLPLEVTPDAPKVKVVATYTPGTAVSYIAKFLERHKADLDIHIERMKSGETSDPFLLILSPDKKVAFFKTRQADESLHNLVAQFSTVSLGRSIDYKKVMAYCAAGLDSSNNLAFRMILNYEHIPGDTVHELLTQALEDNRTLGAVIGDSLPGNPPEGREREGHRDFGEDDIDREGLIPRLINRHFRPVGIIDGIG